MSTLAKDLAERMASGEMDSLPRLAPGSDPVHALNLLSAFYRLRDLARADQAEFGAGWSLRDRIAAAAVRREIEAAIADARRWLSRIARRGGQGVPLEVSP